MKKLVFVAAILTAAIAFNIQSAKAYAPQELVVNGDFESSPVRWVDHAGIIGAWTPKVWHSGSRGANLGATVSGADSIAQSVVLPSNASSIIFTAWYQFFSSETGPSADHMQIFVENFDVPTDVWYQRDFYPNINETGPVWTQVAADFTQFRGKRAFIFLYFYEDGQPYSYGFVDDVSIIADFPDSTPPTTAATSAPAAPNGGNSYFTSAPTVTLSASDAGGSGLNKTFYNWDAGPYTQYGGPIVVPEGTHTLYFYSTDNAGNADVPKTSVYRVDSLKPSIVLSVAAPDGLNGWYQTVPIITLTGSDTTSGVAALRYRWDTSSVTAYASPITAPEGTHTLYVSAVDQAGNASDETALVINVDAGGPQIVLAGSTYSETVYAATATIIGTATDATSGLARLTINGRAVTVDGAGRFSQKITLKQGSNTVTITATDAAGRTTTIAKTIMYRKTQVLGDSVEVPIVTRIRKSTVRATSNPKTQERITITGQNFTQKTKVKVGKRTPSKVVYKNGQTLVILIPLSKYTVGKYNIAVTNPDGQTSTKAKALSVTR